MEGERVLWASPQVFPHRFSLMRQFYSEPKRKVHLSLTNEACSRLSAISEVAGLSKSETLERLLRNTEPYEGLVLIQQSA